MTDEQKQRVDELKQERVTLALAVRLAGLRVNTLTYQVDAASLRMRIAVADTTTDDVASVEQHLVHAQDRYRRSLARTEGFLLALIDIGLQDEVERLADA
jgi:hypothetical protein